MVDLSIKLYRHIPWRKVVFFISLLHYVSGESDFIFSSLMSRNAHDDKNGRFGERAARLTILAKLAILAIFCQFRQISSSIGIDTTRVNIGEFGDFGDFDKFGNFGDIFANFVKLVHPLVFTPHG